MNPLQLAAQFLRASIAASRSQVGVSRSRPARVNGEVPRSHSSCTAHYGFLRSQTSSMSRPPVHWLHDRSTSEGSQAIHNHRRMTNMKLRTLILFGIVLWCVMAAFGQDRLEVFG